MCASRSENSSGPDRGIGPGSATAALAILGGSSAFTPALADAFADAARDLPPLDIRLHGRNRERLEIVTRFCNRLARARSVPHEYTYTTSIGSAAAGARVVINQMRIGSWAGRAHDDLFSLAFGIPGDETIGPGGLASAVRGVPVVLEAAKEAARVSPEAWFINMSNPMGILLLALQSIKGLRCFGLCELPALTLEKALALAGVDREGVEVDFLALNHQGWFTRIVSAGEDLLPAIFARVGEKDSATFFRVDPGVMQSLHALPLPYMRIYYHTRREVERLQAQKASRGEELFDLSARLYEVYRDTDENRLPDSIRSRGLVWFRMALVPAVTALLGGGKRELYVSEVNGGDFPGLPPKAVVEKRCFLGPDGPEMIPFFGSPPTEGGRLEPLLALLRKVVRFEEAALAAALDPIPEKIADALRSLPIELPEETVQGLTPLVLKSVDGPAAPPGAMKGGAP